MTQFLAAARRRWQYLAAAALTIALRVPGMVNGLPYVRHPDEPVNYVLTHRMVTAPSLLPHFYDYPSLQYWLQGSAHALLLGAGRLLGVWDSGDELGMIGPTGFGNNKVMSSAAWLVARGVTVMVSVVGVLAVVYLATRLCRSRGWAFVGGALAAVSGIGVSSGFTMTPDALAGTTAMLTMVCLTSLLLEERTGTGRRWVVVTGVCLGLAVGAKYNNLFLVLALVLAVALAAPAVRPTVRQCMAVVGIALGVFVLSTPAVLFDRQAFVDAIRGVLRHYSVGHFGSEGDSLSANVRAFWLSDAVAVVLAGVALVLRPRRPVLLLAVWAIGYTLLISRAEVHFTRNLTPVLGSVAVLAAIGAQQLWRVTAEQWNASGHRRLRRVGIVVVLVVLLGPVGVADARRTGHDLRLQLTDYQRPPREWLAATIPPGSNVLMESYSPWLDLDTYDVTKIWFIFGASADEVANADVAVITSSGSGRFLRFPDRYPDQVTALASITDLACDTKTFQDDTGYTVDVLFLHCDP